MLFPIGNEFYYFQNEYLSLKSNSTYKDKIDIGNMIINKIIIKK